MKQKEANPRRMKLAKKYTHYVARTDAPEKITPCTSLDEAKRCAEIQWEIAHYKDKPQYDICERDGRVVAFLVDGSVREKEGQ